MIRMRVVLHKQFRKRYQKLAVGEKRRCKEKLRIFVENPFHSLLNNHALGGEYRGYRSIDIAGDLRALYEPVDVGTAHFIYLGTHSELYSR